ncbi:uncharacterized protein LOC117900659 [Drosophila subobscura]|uniref:uncharacterized protein LOC117900659 n=1 Tax=Drosophila subobscura TaxID=7241 RepID=UPI00155B3895|nr:uncharacterized protein LOC117900659 [Drosophila subobscura]
MPGNMKKSLNILMNQECSSQSCIMSRISRNRSKRNNYRAEQSRGLLQSRAKQRNETERMNTDGPLEEADEGGTAAEEVALELCLVRHSLPVNSRPHICVAVIFRFFFFKNDSVLWPANALCSAAI